VIIGRSLEGRPWAEAVESGHVDQANVNSHPAASGSGAAAEDSTLPSDVRPTYVVNTVIICTLNVVVQTMLQCFVILAQSGGLPYTNLGKQSDM